MCERFFLSNILDISQINKNANEKELFQSSKKENFFIAPSKSDEHNSFDTFSNLNSSSYLKLNSSTELYNTSNNNSFNDIIPNYFNINNNTKTIAKSKNENLFLGKKRKIYFYVIKKGHKKPFFLTYNINNITSNNSNKDYNNIFYRQNKTNKESEKNDTSEKHYPKNKKVKLFNTYIELDKSPKQNLKEGRWSYDEHIKFIIAYVNYRNKYELIDKFISSRNIIQIRSHAQKFFKRLKQMQNNEYDFSSDEIKNLFDIFDIIGDNNKTNINNKEYIIKTLISFCDNISKEEVNNLEQENEKKENVIIKDEEEKTLDELFLANKRDINMDTYENDEINKDNTYSKGIDLNNIIEREQNKEVQEQDNYLDYNCIYNMSNNKFNDDNIFLLGDLDCFCSDEISSKVINDISYKIRKSHYLNLISKYFS